MRDSANGLNRRDFVRTFSAGALIPVLRAEGLHQMLAPRRSRVVLVRTADRRRGVTRAIELLDPSGIAGKRVVLKPNVVCRFRPADRVASCSTTLRRRARHRRSGASP